MAVALTPFEALCGFRPLNEIGEHMEKYPELQELVGENISKEFLDTVKSTGDSTADQDIAHNKSVLKKTFAALMQSSQENVTHLLAKLISRLKESQADDTISKLLIRLDQQYPGGDVGVFSSLLLNYVSMEPGQAIFLGANEPHAYLSGGKITALFSGRYILIARFFIDCVECMATSDNVVRAGLTPKFKDVDVLVNMLTYRYGSAESQKMTPVKFAEHSLLYDPPIEEFSVIWTKMEAKQTEKHKPIDGPSILLVTSGSGSLTSETLKTESNYPLEEGYIYFVGANTPLVAQSDASGLEFYRAYSIATDI
jgi:mannose-6-phosphate isomerase